MRIMKDFTKKFQNLAVSGKNSGGFSAHKLRMEGGYGGGTKDHSKKGNGFPSPFWMRTATPTGGEPKRLFHHSRDAVNHVSNVFDGFSSRFFNGFSAAFFCAGQRIGCSAHRHAYRHAFDNISYGTVHFYHPFFIRCIVIVSEKGFAISESFCHPHPGEIVAKHFKKRYN